MRNYVISRLISSNRILHRKCRFKEFATVACRDVKSEYQPVIGLEIHAQIASQSKLFSAATADYCSTSNTNVAYLDCAFPGTLPVLNKTCVEAGIRAALALQCKINLVSTFDRKHYFYADLPAGYQITQQRRPLAVDGAIEYVVYEMLQHPTATSKRTRIIQIQLEQDSGKSIHDDRNNRSLIDLNRCGIGLLEIVTDHNLESGLEAACLVRELQAILRATNSCDGRMERGQLRVDANISVRRHGQPLGTRTEVKNLNSFRFVHRAIEYEIERQIEMIESGKEIVFETRTFDFRTGHTLPMRDKEILQDYRFMPEPNLPPLTLIDSSEKTPCSSRAGDFIDVNTFRLSKPTFAADIRRKWINDHGLTLENAMFLQLDEYLFALFDRLITEFNCHAAKTVRLFVAYQRPLNLLRQDWSTVVAEDLADIINWMNDSKITDLGFKALMEFCLKKDKRRPKQIAEELNLFVTEDLSLVDRACDEILAENPNLVANYIKAPDKNRRKLARMAFNRLSCRYPRDKLEEIFRNKLDKSS